MKTHFFAVIAMLTALNAWAVEQQSYLNPSVLPDAFAWEVVRYDYYKSIDTAEPVLVDSQYVTVVWDPVYVNKHGSYGKLTLMNFYDHSRLMFATWFLIMRLKPKEVTVILSGMTISRNASFLLLPIIFLLHPIQVALILRVPHMHYWHRLIITLQGLIIG